MMRPKRTTCLDAFIFHVCPVQLFRLLGALTDCIPYIIPTLCVGTLRMVP